MIDGLCLWIGYNVLKIVNKTWEEISQNGLKMAVSKN